MNEGRSTLAIVLAPLLAQPMTSGAISGHFTGPVSSVALAVPEPTASSRALARGRHCFRTNVQRLVRVRVRSCFAR